MEGCMMAMGAIVIASR
uniref:Uncharacterized protein n=1 Tax=Rhizophora mucronata TaxID=61149 RepID=A0A2P2P750_RHIMU